MGDPLDPENRVGALVSTAHFEKVKSYLDEAGKAALGRRHRGRHLRRADRRRRRDARQPALPGGGLRPGPRRHHLRDGGAGGRARQRHALRPRGLGLHRQPRNAIRLAREIRAGVVTVNCFGEGDVTTPFGGYKESGFGGRDKSIFAHDQYTELKTIWIDVVRPRRTRWCGDTAPGQAPAGRHRPVGVGGDLASHPSRPGARRGRDRRLADRRRRLRRPVGGAAADAAPARASGSWCSTPASWRRGRPGGTPAS